MCRNLAYITTAFRIILKRKDRNTIEYLQNALCNVILYRYDDFANDYKCLNNFKKYQTFEECLAFIFKIDQNKIIQVLSILNEFKNVQNDTPRCMSIKLNNI
ncbi:TPA: hypothetical protein RTH14_001688 [Campylobacter jejuni]|nr:hypothetical protein [Campylobacter jejuni]HDZ5099467.1 hypothetical protein [Campylobacter jejuni]HDZ5102828.1 hypothetical protein [Campylobacter jejuni]HDZ5104495.1 hypothetical protein [Campylobacter jejuni]HDZ5109020.1 hypothetical protein [Campylobacter jejuni]